MYICVDTGNRARSVIDESVYRSLHPKGELEPTDLVLTTAGQNQHLNVLGRTKEFVELKFYNPTTSDFVKYQVRPVVVRGLQLPFILSLNDLRKLKATISPHLDEVLFNTNSGPVKIKLAPLPGSAYDVTTKETITIAPNEEIVTKVGVDKADRLINRDLVFQPGTGLSTKGLISSATVSTVNKLDKSIIMRVANINPHPITLRKGTDVGIAQVFGTEGFKWNSEIVGVINPTKDTVVTRAMSRKALYHRLWTDLGFDKDNTLTETEKRDVVRLFALHRKALALDPEDVGSIKGVKINIDTGDHAPVKVKCRPLPPHLLETLKEQIRKWLSQKVISPCQGPWASPIVPVRKPNGTYRFAVDYRALNLITKKDARPVANMAEKLANLKSTPEKPYKYWATLDLSEAYHCVSVDEDSREKTAMITPCGLYQFNRMSFGLAAAPQAFHEVVQMIEAGLVDKNPDLSKSILMYFDDAIVGGTSFEDLMAKLELFINQIEELGLRIGPKKCRIGARELVWLGHRISERGIRPDIDRVKTLNDWPTPKNTSEVKAIHGLASYFRKFIRNFAARTANIRGLMKTKNQDPKDKFNWTKECQDEFKDLVDELTGPNILGHPDFDPKSEPFILSCDTSKLGVGCILSQFQKIKDENNNLSRKEILIAYGSRSLTTGEKHYSSFKLELAGLVSSVEHFKYFLMGKQFIVRTDHRALKWLMSTTHNECPAIVFRWQQTLSDYNFIIEYVPAAKMKAADGLSRKGYQKNDNGVMIAPCHKREPLWHSDFDSTAARIRDDDEFWLPVVKSKFTENTETKPSGNCSILAITRSRRIQENSNSSEGEVSDNSTVELVESEESETKGLTNFCDKYPDSTLLTPLEIQEELKQGFMLTITDHKNMTEYFELDKDIDKSSSFETYLKRFQEEDIALKHIKECLEDKHPWPSDYEAIRKRLLELFQCLKIGKELPMDDLTKVQLSLVWLFRKKQRIFLSKNGILGLRNPDNKAEIYLIPQSIQKLMIQIVHSSPGAIHLGINRTNMLCSKYFEFYNMTAEIAQHINTCAQCIEGKKLGSSNNPGLGSTMSNVNERLKRFSLDIVNMPQGRGGNKFIFTLLDLSTGWLEAFALTAATSQNILNKIENNIIPRYSEGLVLICDGGTEFTSKLMKKTITANGCKLYISTNYWPNSNPVERAHRTLVSLIKIILLDKQWSKEKWPLALPEALKTFNCSPDSSSTTSPFSRVFGKNPVIRTDLTIGCPKTEESKDLKAYPPVAEVEKPEITETPEHVIIKNQDQTRVLKKGLFTNNKLMIQEVCNIQEEIPQQEMFQLKKDFARARSHEQNEIHYTKRKRLYVPIVNELVDFMRPLDPESKSSRKLAFFWNGPYQITKVHPSEKTAEIVELDQVTLEKVAKARKVHLTYLRPSLFLAFKNRLKINEAMPWDNEIPLSQIPQ